MKTWPSMGISCGSEFAGGVFYWDRRGRKAGFDRGNLPHTASGLRHNELIAAHLGMAAAG